jgi:hypothetical protein|tara:strand:- start:1340 stop:1450 length:111 start_codon:yes stop_codon:yes gene_type:complete
MDFIIGLSVVVVMAAIIIKRAKPELYATLKAKLKLK